MTVGVTEILAEKHGIDARVSRKIECPICKHKTFYVKRDDSIGKCFHPQCGHYITPNQSQIAYSGISKILNDFYKKCKSELLDQLNPRGQTAYKYLTRERKIHPLVVAHSMIGVVPSGYNIDAAFRTLINSRENDGNEGGDFWNKIEPEKAKLGDIIARSEGWIAFFYCDCHFNIVSVKFRKPSEKIFMRFKPSDVPGGVFGHDLFCSDHLNEQEILSKLLFVCEGEFDILQTQSLMANIAELKKLPVESQYIYGCAVGSVNSADIETVSRLSDRPLVCYDNDDGAGYKLVERFQEYLSLEVCTTPVGFKDIDEFIRSYDSDYNSAFEKLKALIGNRQKRFINISAVEGKVAHTRKDKDLKAFEKDKTVSELIIKDMSCRGKFYFDLNRVYYFDESTKKLVLIEHDIQELKILLSRYGINASEKIYKFVLEALLVFGRTRGEFSQIHRFCHYNRHTNTLYWFNNDNQIYKITTDDLQLVDNGTDSVLFLFRTDFEKFSLLLDKMPREMLLENTEEPLLNKYLSLSINFDEGSLTRTEYQMVFEWWLYSLFFESIMPTKPILAVIGEAGSGKSMAIRKVGKLLFGNSFDVMQLTSDPKDFDSAVANNPIVAIDNVDSTSKWLNDKLASLATGSVLNKRRYYTTNDQETIQVKCFLILTSRDPHFRREDVAERLLILKLNRIESKMAENTLLKELIENREAILTDIAYFLQEILLCLKAHESDTITTQFRIADFAEFALKIAKHSGGEDEAIEIFNKLTAEQSKFALENEEFVDLIELWLDKDNEGREIIASELCRELATVADQNSIQFFYGDKPKPFAHKLAKIKQCLQEFFIVNVREAGGRKKFYSFKRKYRDA